MKQRSRYARMVLSALLFLGLTSGLLAQQDFNPDDVRIPFEKIVLDNGFTVLVHEDHSVPIVAVNMWYHVGSRNEKRGRTGFAHLFEHFFFNGSENHPFGFREAMDDIGANNRNGTTNTDRTNFFEDVPVSALERTLFLESDRLGYLAGYINEGNARTRTRRGAKRKTAGGEPALRSSFWTHCRVHLPLFAPLQLVHDRQNGGPRRR